MKTQAGKHGKNLELRICPRRSPVHRNGSAAARQRKRGGWCQTLHSATRRTPSTCPVSRHRTGATDPFRSFLWRAPLSANSGFKILQNFVPKFQKCWRPNFTASSNMFRCCRFPYIKLSFARFGNCAWNAPFCVVIETASVALSVALGSEVWEGVHKCKHF